MSLVRDANLAVTLYELRVSQRSLEGCQILRWSWFSRKEPYKLVFKATESLAPDWKWNRNHHLPRLLSLLIPLARLLMLPLVDSKAWVIQ
jgi:hypothetical protein